MRGTLYLHIGPPKTATTALQYFLQDGLDDVLVYGGVSQPRGRRNGELSGRLHYACSSVASETDLAKLRAEIESVLEGGLHLFVSEEMFLVDQGESKHQHKIHELGRIVGGFSPRVIVGLRDPVAGLRSLYQELYPSLPLRQRVRFSKFLSSNQAKVFDYEYLFQLLERSGFTDPGLIPFDRFVNNQLRLADLVEVSADQDQCLLPQPVNQGAIDTSGRRRFRAITLSDLGQKVAVRIRGAEALGQMVLRSQAVGEMWTSVKHVRVWRDSSRELFVPPSLERDLTTKFEQVTRRRSALGSRDLREEDLV